MGTLEQLYLTGPRVEPLAEAVHELEKLAMTAADLAAARAKTDTDPSEAKKESGNYKKGKVSWEGLTISIENPKGSTRSGTSSDGKKWSQKMHHDYGYFLGSVGKDKDHVDVFIGPELESELVFIVNQVDGKTFDEHKVVIGTINEDQAREVYLANYEDGWQGLGSLVAMTLPAFKKWVLDSKATSKQADDCPPGIKLAVDTTVQAYKQLRTLSSRPGEVFPLFIDKTQPLPQEEWLEAENIPTKGFAPRPGFHAGALPAAPHLRSKEDRIQPNRVWAEVEMPADVDWQTVADESPTGDLRDQVPEGGYYRKSTPQMQGGEWLIGGGLKINQVLSDDQVSEILRQAGELDAAEKERRGPVNEATINETEGEEKAASGSGSGRGRGVGRLCPGCGEAFKEDEPYPDVENCERCERFGTPKEAAELEKIGSGPVEKPRVRFVLPYNDEYLLQQAVNPKWQGYVRNPGGGIDGEETPEQAALREFKEEFGQDLTPERLKYLGVDPREEFSSHHFYEIPDHGLEPGTFQASNDPDEIVNLVQAAQGGDKYLGPTEPFKMASEEHVPTVAVDLDGTLAVHYDEFDEDHIPDPRPGAKKWMQKFKDAGARIIIFTVRGKDEVTKAWFKKHDIPYDYLNENPDQPEGSSDKVYADVYWDDRAISAAGRLASSAPEVLNQLKVAEDSFSSSDPEEVLLAIQLYKDAA